MHVNAFPILSRESGFAQATPDRLRERSKQKGQSIDLKQRRKA